MTAAGAAGLGHDPAIAAAPDRLWTQREAAAFLGVSTRYLRDSPCPKVLLPGTGSRGRAIVRYVPADVRSWALQRRVT
jgi:hypothetical protein